MRENILQLIKTAGADLRNYFYESAHITDKSPKDLETEYDRRIEKKLTKGLLDLHRGAHIYGEEQGNIKGTEDRLFVIDPIDGTANFIFGVPYFAISITEIINNKITLGIVFNPMTNDLYYADSENPATLNGTPIKAGGRSKLEESFIIFGFSAHSKNIARYQKEWPRAFEESRKALPLLSPSLNLCSVASGKADAFIDFGCSFEGQAAGAYILQKAGGTVSDYDTPDYDFRKTGIIAANSVLRLEKKGD